MSIREKVSLPVIDDDPEPQPEPVRLSRRSLAARFGMAMAAAPAFGRLARADAATPPARWSSRAGVDDSTSTTTVPTESTEATALQTSRGAVDVSGAAPPAPGEVLTAVSGRRATWQAPAGVSGSAGGTLRRVVPQGGQAVLIDPNRADGFLVQLPPHAQGGVRSTTILPVKGAPTTGRLWTRLVQFQQPGSGPVVTPHLEPEVLGPRPRWGSAGHRSTDLVSLVSNDGQHWMIVGSVSVQAAQVHSALSSEVGAPAGSVDPLGLPDPLVQWTSVDMATTNTDRSTTFHPGERVGVDLSGAGNDLLVNSGGTVDFHLGPLPGAMRTAASPYVVSRQGRAGIGCSFSAGPVADWTVIVAFLPSALSRGRRLSEAQIFQTRSADSASVALAVKYAGLAYTFDGQQYNNFSWSSPVFAKPSSTAVPSVVGWSAKAGLTASPLVLAGSLLFPIARSGPGGAITSVPPTIAGIDFPLAYPLCGVLVYGAALSESDMAKAALRLGYVGFGEGS